MEILIMSALLARIREVAPGIHLRLYNLDASRLLDDLDADEVDLAIGYEGFPCGGSDHASCQNIKNPRGVLAGDLVHIGQDLDSDIGW
jgi:DNA-binding transcriptional LysR family regulator